MNLAIVIALCVVASVQGLLGTGGAASSGVGVGELPPEVSPPVRFVPDTLAHLHWALRHVGERETRPNSSVKIDGWLRAAGVAPGNPWCAAFVGASLREAERVTHARIEPTVRSALARSYVSPTAIDAGRVARGSVTVPEGSLVVWQKGTGISGHIGIVRRTWRGSGGLTVEGNTSSGVAGSQSDGEQVALRSRMISPGSYFRIRWFQSISYRVQ